LAAEIVDQAVSVAWVTVDAADCDRWGLQAANLTALRQAIEALTVTPGYVISDGYAIDGLSMPSRRVIRGDQQIACVAAASIIAKVNRDRIMIDLDRQFPGYGFAGHKGYGTLAHQSVLERLGPSPQHRMSYRNVAKATRVG
jgi:ribonuclease HII